MQFARQNTVIAGGAATLNLGLAFVPPLFATLISTAVTAVVAANSRRALAAQADISLGASRRRTARTAATETFP